MVCVLNPRQQELAERARHLAQTNLAPRAAEIDRSERYPTETLEGLKRAGLIALALPKSLGGQGLSYLDTVIVIEEIARACAVSARIVVESNMGAVGAIMSYGTEAQKKTAADLVLAGDKPAICITEPGAGSAASELTTRADRRGDAYVLNGTKHWITGGGVSRLHLIFARLFDDAGHELGIGGFIALRDEDEGLIVGRREPTMGLRGIPETEIVCRDLKLGADRLVLPPEGPAAGFGKLMEAYNAQRVGAAAIALGIAEGAFEHALAYAQERKQFGRPISEFQGLQWMLADMRTALDAARLMVHAAAASADPFPDPRLAAQAKILAAETAIKVTNDALQLHGAAGYSRNNPLERMVRDARMFTIGGGTAQVLRTMVASKLLGRKLPQTRDGYRDEIGPPADWSIAAE
ncbi:MAG: 3-sulfinopropanoyl-CoA desulfinase [Geminicoccaceae bacterium]